MNDDDDLEDLDNVGDGGAFRGLVAALMAVALIYLCIAGLSGCGSSTTREEKREQTDVRRTWHVAGTVAVPGIQGGIDAQGSSLPLTLPIDLTIDGGGADQTTGELHAETKDLTAQKLAGMVVGELASRIPLLAGVGAQMRQPPPAEPGTDWGKIGTAVGGLAAAWGVRELGRRGSDASWDQERQAAIDAASHKARAEALAEAARAQGARLPLLRQQPPAGGA